MTWSIGLLVISEELVIVHSFSSKKEHVFNKKQNQDDTKPDLDILLFARNAVSGDLLAVALRCLDVAQQPVPPGSAPRPEADARTAGTRECGPGPVSAWPPRPFSSPS